jgi:myo-inositol-1(or 4)-monophosphatase
MTNFNLPLDFAVATAKEVGETLLKHFGTELTKKIKTGPGDYATEADEASEKLILERLTEAFPDDAIITEESGSHGSQSAEYTWIVDPLDGTHNFASGSKDFGVMISRAKGEELEIVVVWNPAHQILATAQRGQGSKLNDIPVQLPSADQNDQSLSVEKDNQEQLKEIGYGVTNLGASANTLVTLAGERRGFVSSNGFIWDFAPPALLLAEAGWKVTDFGGNPFRWTGKVEYGYPGVIAAPADLHQKLLHALR